MSCTNIVINFFEIFDHGNMGMDTFIVMIPYLMPEMLTN